MSIVLYACGTDDITDQIVNAVQAEDEHVLAVKNGTPNAYPGKKYGEPDYTEENVEIVEFTGYCTYQDVEVKALIQFTLSKDDNTFEATYLSFNNVPQNMFMLSALLETVFTGDEMDDSAADHTAEYTGMWWDTYSQRCNMEISSADGIYYNIEGVF